LEKYIELLKKIFCNAEDKFDLYATYYRVCYYYPFGRKRINHAKEVIPGKKAVVCTVELDSESRQHKNFLYAPVKPRKWLYWTRKFAYRIEGGSWLLLPRLTPWETKNGQTKFGLNFTFVQKLSPFERENIRFVTWL